MREMGFSNHSVVVYPMISEKTKPATKTSQPETWEKASIARPCITMCHMKRLIEMSPSF